MHSTQSNIFETLSAYFGNIYVLTMSSRKNRTTGILNQLRDIGWDNDMQKIHIHYATSFPYNDLIANAFNLSKKGRFTKPNEYDCSRNHYAMVKEAYDLGYERILILEDDIRFLSNEDTWNKFMDAIPKKWDILQFGGFTTDERVIKYIENNGCKWVSHKDVGLWNCSMYALSRKGMEFYIAFMDKLFWVADGPLYKAPINDALVTTLMSSIPLVIQEDKGVVQSDIRSDENDKIDYNNDNLYERFIDKSDYYAYREKK